MKSKILTFVIGFLVGAIITTSGFLIYNKVVVSNSKPTEMTQMDEKRTMQNTTNGNMEGDMGEPPEKPSSEKGEEPPTKPNESNNNTNS